MTATFTPPATTSTTSAASIFKIPTSNNLINFSPVNQDSNIDFGLNSGYNLKDLGIDLNFGGKDPKSPTSFFNPNKDGFNYKSLVDILGAGAGIFNSYLGAKALSESKRQAKFNEGVVSANLLAQSKLTNEQLATRDITREKGGFNDGLTHDQFVAKYSVPGTVGG